MRHVLGMVGGKKSNQFEPDGIDQALSIEHREALAHLNYSREIPNYSREIPKFTPYACMRDLPALCFSTLRLRATRS